MHTLQKKLGDDVVKKGLHVIFGTHVTNGKAIDISGPYMVISRGAEISVIYPENKKPSQLGVIIRIEEKSVSFHNWIQKYRSYFRPGSLTLYCISGKGKLDAVSEKQNLITFDIEKYVTVETISIKT